GERRSCGSLEGAFFGSQLRLESQGVAARGSKQRFTPVSLPSVTSVIAIQLNRFTLSMSACKQPEEMCPWTPPTDRLRSLAIRFETTNQSSTGPKDRPQPNTSNLQTLTNPVCRHLL